MPYSIEADRNTVIKNTPDWSSDKSYFKENSKPDLDLDLGFVNGQRTKWTLSKYTRIFLFR